MYVIIYVDDIMITGSCKIEIDMIKVNLTKNFKTKDLGLLHCYLGMYIKQSQKP